MDIESVESLQVPEDVIDLILKRFARTRTTLGILSLLHAWAMPSGLDLIHCLEKPVSEISKLMLLQCARTCEPGQEKGGDWKFEFVHDEIEKAVYSLFRKRTGNEPT